MSNKSYPRTPEEAATEYVKYAEARIAQLEQELHQQKQVVYLTQMARLKMEQELKTIRAQAFEEAAKVAEGVSIKSYVERVPQPGAMSAAVAIRARAKREQEKP